MTTFKMVFFVPLMLSVFWCTSSQPTCAGESNENGGQRSLADLVRSMDQATIRDGFIIHLFTDSEVRKAQAATTEHNRRHQEYLEKNELLSKRSNDLKRNSPPNFSRTLSTADRLFKRYDKNNDGILDERESASVRPNGEGMDANGDNRVEKQEFLRWMISKINAQRRGRGGRPVPAVADPFGRVVPAPAPLPVPAPAAAPAPAAGGFPLAQVEVSDKEIEELLAEQNAITELHRKLYDDYKEVTSYRGVESFYKIMEATDEFIRLRNEKEERIIPHASIKEFRRSVMQKK